MSPAILTRLVGVLVPIRIPADMTDDQAMMIAKVGLSSTEAFRELRYGPFSLVRLKAKDAPQAPEGFEAKPESAVDEAKPAREKRRVG